VQFAMMAALPATVRDGGSSFAAVHGAEMWDYYAAHPAAHAVFDATMNALGKLGAADVAIATGADWARWADVVVDVGGGYGEMALTILADAPRPPRTAVVFDMPAVVARAAAAWAGEGNAAAAAADNGAGVRARLAARPALRDAVRFAGGDMFDSATYPARAPGARAAFLLRDILHDWPDADSVRILRGVRGAMARGDCVVVVGRALAPGAGFVESLGNADADIVMLGAFGSTAGERAVAHYARLFAEAGLRLASAAPTRSQYSIIRAVLDDAPEGA
jgi:hypothetical protein